MICLSQSLIFTNRESLLEKEQEERESLQFKMALFALQTFFIMENLAVLEKQLNSKNHSVGRNSHKKLSENSKKPGSISLSSYFSVNQALRRLCSPFGCFLLGLSQYCQLLYRI